jgi:hypothetical protein
LKDYAPFQAHHIIPIEILKTHETVQKAVIAGFRFNDKVDGIPVPPEFHNTAHRELNEAISDEINKWASLNKKASSRQIIKYLEKDLIPRWRKNWLKVAGLRDDVELRLKAANDMVQRLRP